MRKSVIFQSSASVALLLSASCAAPTAADNVAFAAAKSLGFAEMSIDLKRGEPSVVHRGVRACGPNDKGIAPQH
jgi:hypothetical protein